MTRSSLLAVAVVLAACHPPSLKDRAVAMGHKTVAIVAPIRAKLHLQVDTDAASRVAIGMAKDAVQQRLAASGPIVLHKSVQRDAVQRDAAAPPAQVEQPPAVQVTHVDAAKPDMFVLRGTTHGGKQICEAYTSMAECTSSCTAKLQANALVPAAQVDPASAKDCACLEQSGGC